MKKILVSFLLSLCVFGFYHKDEINNLLNKQESYNIEEIPEYNNQPYVIINNNKPKFTDDDYKSKTFEKYSRLDKLGRSGVALANIGKELMPTKKRESIGMIKPSGWHTVKYNNIEGKYLYNRCHLIGYQLTGENANENNLITCTRNMNMSSMLKFENEVASYIKETGNHVLYRVTPIYENNNLLATGVQIEASSVEDKCSEICFNVFVYNVQDGIDINYQTGESKLKN